MGPFPELRRMARLLWPERRHYALGLVALAVVNVADVIGPLFIALAVDLVAARHGGPAPGMPALFRWLGITPAHFGLGGAIAAYLALQVLSNAARYPMMMEVSVPSHRVGQRLRNRLVDRLLRLGRPFYDRTGAGPLMSTTTSDVNAVRMFLGPGILVAADTLMLVVLVLGVMVALSWPLTVAALLPLPLLALATHRFSHAEYRWHRAVQDDLARLTERARETYAGLRIVQGYAREKHEAGRFGADSRRHLGLNLRLARVRSLYDPSLEVLLGLSVLLVLVAGGAQLARGRLSVGTFLAFTFLVGQLSGPMIGFGWAVSLFQRGRASLGRIEHLAGAPLEVEDAPGAVAADGPGALELRGLTFRFPGAPRPALDDVSLRLPPGRTLGIVGPVGSGKSTLLALLVRLYDPPPGTVFLDGADVRGLTLASLRRAVVLAPQDAFLFGDTVTRNVLPGADGDRSADALRLAGLAAVREEIEALPQGPDTLLGERGINLSGGQRQRVALARTLAAGPRVLLLDDSLSAVDAPTEARILAGLAEALAGRSAVIVSHRVQAVRGCDEILVLDAGRVVARGRHEELLAAGGWYATIATEQARGGDTP